VGAYIREIVQEGNELLHIRSRGAISVIGDYLCESVLGVLGKSEIGKPGKAMGQRTWAPF
jgi:hypothetical protein